MANRRSDGSDRISVLTLLAAFKREANNNGISEGMGKLVLPYFLTGYAHTSYKSALHVDAMDSSTVGIKSWLEAI